MKIKTLTSFTLICLMMIACGPGSSPEGRMGMRIDKLQNSLDSMTGMQQQIDHIKVQNAAIMDSLRKVRADVTALKKK